MRSPFISIVLINFSLEGAHESFIFHRLGDRLSQELALRGFDCFQFDLPFEKEPNDTAKSVLDRMSSSMFLRNALSLSRLMLFVLRPALACPVNRHSVPTNFIRATTRVSNRANLRFLASPLRPRPGFTAALVREPCFLAWSRRSPPLTASRVHI